MRSSCLLFSIINGAEATQPIVPIKPEPRLATSRMGGCKTCIWIMFMKFAIKPMSKAFFGPMRSQIRPAGRATKPVASVLMVNIMPMKSG